jgi:small subunit ribosomal protein S8
MKNPLGNMIANIKTGQLNQCHFILQNRKKICENLLKILWEEGFILGYTINIHNPTQLKIFLKYNSNKPVINSIKIISKPSRKIYYSVKQIWKIDSSKNFIIFSTNQGLKSIIDCKKLKIGGEPFIILN